jgi:hypothetical protein
VVGGDERHGQDLPAVGLLGEIDRFARLRVDGVQVDALELLIRREDRVPGALILDR